MSALLVFTYPENTKLYKFEMHCIHSPYELHINNSITTTHPTLFSYIRIGLVLLQKRSLCYLDEVSPAFLAADVVLLLGGLEGQQLLGDAQVSLQNGLLHPRLSAPLHLVLQSVASREHLRNAATETLHTAPTYF